MDSEEQRAALRAAIYRRDGPAVVHLLHGAGAYDDSLQLAGDGLVAAVIQRVDGASELARNLAVALRRRGWEGDDPPLTSAWARRMPTYDVVASFWRD